MSKDFRAAGGQEKSCAINRLKSLKEYESLDFRLKHSQRATVNNVTVQRVPDGRHSAAEGAFSKTRPGDQFLQ